MPELVGYRDHQQSDLLMTIMTGGHALVRSLEAEGVEVVFGLPGSQIMHAFDAFFDCPGIKLIVPRHEQATVYMADGYARATGKVGVALTVPGPGVLNTLAALGTAYACSSPVLLLAGQIHSDGIGKRTGQLHELDDQLEFVRPVTKWCNRVLKVQDITGAVHEAMRQMKTGRPRPVEVEIPHDILATKADVSFYEAEKYARQEPDAQLIRKAAELLLSAERPMILAGGGCNISDASDELLALAEFLQAPVITTPEGKGVLSEDHYLSLVATYAGIGPGQEILKKADVLLAVGTRFSVMGLPQDPSRRCVHINIDESEIGKIENVTIGIPADAKSALAALLEQLKAGSNPRRSHRTELETQKRHVWEELRSLAPQQIRIVEAIRNELSDDAILVSGMTCIGYWCHLAYVTRKPRTYFTPSYFGTLGYAFPTALGIKTAKPDKPVVAITGDGGFMFSAQELATAVNYGINVLTIVFNDGAYGASKCRQIAGFNDRRVGTDLHNPDFVRLAEAFGAIGLRAESPGQIGPLIRKALSLSKPVVLEVIVPSMEPPFEMRKRATER